MSKLTVSDYFSLADLDRIREAVTQAERSTSAEIVPFIVERSDNYEEVFWRAGILAGSVALALLGALRVGAGLWLPVSLTGIVLIVLLLAAAAMLAVRSVPFLRRTLAGKELIEQRVMQKAKEAFLAEQIFATRERTGILLFISLLEHQVLVLGDSGISARFTHADWSIVIDRVVKGLRSEQAVDGVVEAIQRMARLLEERGFVKRMDDRNELPDRPREGVA